MLRQPIVFLCSRPRSFPPVKGASTEKPSTHVELLVRSSPQADVEGRTPMAQLSFRDAFRDDLHSKHRADLLLCLARVPLPHGLPSPTLPAANHRTCQP